MISNKYSDYLKSSKWRKKRLEVLDRDEHKCRMCPNNSLLQIHHITYDRIFNEDLKDLITLCKKCHDDIHGNSPSKHLQKLHRLRIGKQADYARRKLNIFKAKKWDKKPCHMKNEEVIKFYKRIFRSNPEPGLLTDEEFDKSVLRYKSNPNRFNGKKPKPKRIEIPKDKLLEAFLARQKENSNKN